MTGLATVGQVIYESSYVEHKSQETNKSDAST
jgi:hypothetical protein